VAAGGQALQRGLGLGEAGFAAFGGIDIEQAEGFGYT